MHVAWLPEILNRELFVQGNFRTPPFESRTVGGPERHRLALELGSDPKVRNMLMRIPWGDHNADGRFDETMRDLKIQLNGWAVWTVKVRFDRRA